MLDTLRLNAVEDWPDGRAATEVLAAAACLERKLKRLLVSVVAADAADRFRGSSTVGSMRRGARCPTAPA